MEDHGIAALLSDGFQRFRSSLEDRSRDFLLPLRERFFSLSGSLLKGRHPLGELLLPLLPRGGGKRRCLFFKVGLQLLQLLLELAQLRTCTVRFSL